MTYIKKTSSTELENERFPLTVAHAQFWQQRLVHLVDTPSPVVLDLGEEIDCDSAGIQLLIAAKVAAEAAGKELQLKNPSNSIPEAAERLGISLESTFHVTE